MNNYNYIEDRELRKDLEWDEVRSYAGVEGRDRQEFLESLEQDVSQMEREERQVERAEQSGSGWVLVMFIVILYILF